MILEKNALGNFAMIGRYPTGTDPEALALADLNRDGVVDVVTANSTGGSLSVMLHNASLVTAVTTVPQAVPPVRLSQNFPNPFNPATTIYFALSQAERVRLSVFDVQGKVVATLVDGMVPAGAHSVVWHGKTDHGSSVGSGVFFYRLSTASGSQESRRMVMLK